MADNLAARVAAVVERQAIVARLALAQGADMRALLASRDAELAALREGRTEEMLQCRRDLAAAERLASERFMEAGFLRARVAALEAEVAALRATATTPPWRAGPRG